MRNILKSRQIGATFYFAREALIDALTTGRNQIFYAPTPELTQVARAHMQAAAWQVGVNLSTNDAGHVLLHDAQISFLGEENHCAAYSGNVYVDEFPWFKNPRTAFLIAKSMSMHKQYRWTLYGSTSYNYLAFQVWRGDFQRRTHPLPALFMPGSSFGSDGVWRQSLTLEQAIAHGCLLHDLDDIKRECTPEEYRVLFGCDWSQAINNKESVA
ncbi:terminase family protein [Candidatus Symbiopectobacterium sp. PLON1]|uniref:terminase large subunit domain-containing protein n=1 Tax=Candidatus Symbiopectobacterium sp. PLON1 TaxID=2794575 RepID=UPI00345BB12D